MNDVVAVAPVCLTGCGELKGPVAIILPPISVHVKNLENNLCIDNLEQCATIKEDVQKHFLAHDRSQKGGGGEVDPHVKKNKYFYKVILLFYSKNCYLQLTGVEIWVASRGEYKIEN